MAIRRFKPDHPYMYAYEQTAFTNLYSDNYIYILHLVIYYVPIFT